MLSSQISQRVLGPTSRLLFTGTFKFCRSAHSASSRSWSIPTPTSPRAPGVRALQSIDIAVHDAESFAAMKDADRITATVAWSGAESAGGMQSPRLSF